MLLRPALGQGEILVWSGAMGPDKGMSSNKAGYERQGDGGKHKRRMRQICGCAELACVHRRRADPDYVEEPPDANTPEREELEESPAVEPKIQKVRAEGPEED